MRLPRGLTGAELIRHLETLGYRVSRQSGSHVRLTCDSPIQHHVTIPNHDPLRIGTLSAILADVAAHHHVSREELLQRLFG
jgi:predicted RNA binding protein YcfA (HicA-like mRNA interferase family)